MTDYKFKVGDKVKCISGDGDPLGEVGVITSLPEIGELLTVKFDESFDGHDGFCSNPDETESSWFLYPCDVELV